MESDRPFVSFVVPTMGRPTLLRTINSLVAQKDGDYEAIIVPDPAHTSRKPVRQLADTRFSYIKAPRSAAGSAGLLRNEGIRHATGRWIAFVDDDDRITPEYVVHLKEHVADEPTADVVIFRMADPRLGILPDADAPEIKLGKVGISFAVYSVWLQRAGFKFEREVVERQHHEDFLLLNDLKIAQAEFCFSPHIDYLVRDHPSVSLAA